MTVIPDLKTLYEIDDSLWLEETIELLKNSIMILTLKIQVLVIIEKNDKKVKILRIEILTA